MTKIKNVRMTDAAVTSALLDLRRATTKASQPWALIGGQALRAHGVPRDTLDIDAIVMPEGVSSLAELLVNEFEWVPLVYDPESNDYRSTDVVTIHRMDDPVLFDVGEQRAMVPLLSPMNVIVELLSAQHPVEVEMISTSALQRHYEVVIPVAPLGAVLLVKQKADRTKDIGAIEQVAEHLSNDVLREAVEWARERDPATAEDLESTIQAARIRRTPTTTTRIEKKR